MTWRNPLPFTLLGTASSESFRDIPAGFTGVPVGPHPGAFGVRRKHHTHEGVDLYAPEGTPVFAVEAGTVVRVAPFTGEAAGMPWWLPTDAVFIEGESGVVVYGEISVVVRMGDSVRAGQLLGHVKRVLANDKGRPTAMLHLELRTPGCHRDIEWRNEEAQPAELQDPTRFLLESEGTPQLNPFASVDPDDIARLAAELLPRK